MLGRSSSGAGDVEEIACTAQGRALLADSTAAAQRATLGLETWSAPGADTAVNDTNDVKIVSHAVTGLVAGDQVVINGMFTIFNDSAASRVYTVTVDFDGLFDVELASFTLVTAATHMFDLYAVLDIRSTSLAYGVFTLNQGTAAGTASGGDVSMSGTTPGQARGWGTTASDATGSTNVTLHVRSASATATQTLRLHNFTVRKVTP